MSKPTTIAAATLTEGDGVFSLLVGSEWVDVSIVGGALWLRADAFRVPAARTVPALESILNAKWSDISRSTRVAV